MAFDFHDKIQPKSQMVDLYLTADGQLRVVTVEGDESEVRRERERQEGTLISRSGAPTLAGVSLLSLLVAACGGGGSGGGGGGGASTTSGVVVDGYLAGMKVYRLGSPGTFVITDANGAFSGLGGTGAIVAEPSATGATDKSTGLAFLAKLMAPAGATVINPLTTLLQTLGADQEAALKTALGLNANINLLTYDPVAANNVAAQLVSAQIGNLLSAAVKSGTGDVAAQLASKIAAHQTVDLTSSAFLQSIGLSASIADAVSKANSVTATDLAGIAEMQKLVQQLASADPAGQTAALNKFLADFATKAATIDTVAPDAPTAITFTAEGGTVVAGDVNATNTNLTAHATIAAGKATGGKAELLVNGVVVATDSTILATDTHVDFSLSTSTTTALQHALTAGGAVIVKLYDAAGNVASTTAGSSLIVDYVAPTVTMTSSVAALKAGQTTVVTLTFSETPVGFDAADLTTSLGTLSALTVSPTNSKVYTATFTPNTNTDLSNGSITLTGVFTDSAGNAGTAIAALTLAIDTKAPLAPTLALASDTGVSPSDGVTNASTVNVSGIEAGATWEYKIDTGNWTAGTGTSLTLQAGAKTYQVRQTDAAGNVSAESSAVSYTLDTSAPSAPTMALASDTGVSQSDGVTNASTVNVSGIEAGATWEYKIDTGSWTAGTGTSLTLQAGAKTYQVRQTDAAGNVSGATSATYTLDNSAPSAPTMALASDTGASSSDGVTSASTVNVGGLESGATWEYKIDTGSWMAGTGTSLTLQAGAKTYQVRQTDAAGNVSGATSATYTLDTTAPSAPTMALASDTGVSQSDGVTSASTVNVGGLESGATWEYKIDTGSWTAGTGTSLTLQSGAKSYQVRQTDAAGNVSSESSATYTLDTSAAAPTLSLASDTGASTSDGVTSASTVNVGLESGATWEYKIGAGNWTTGTGTSLTLDEGTATYQIRQTDAAGNVSDVSSATYTLDTQAPASLAARAPSLSPGTDAGASHSDGVTSNANPTVIIDLSGLGYAAGDTVVLFDGDTEIARATLTASDISSGLTQYALAVPDATPLSEGAHSLSIKMIDPAGNVSFASATSAVTIDTSAPTLAMDTIAGEFASQNGFNITGTTTGAEAGQIVSVTMGEKTYQGVVLSDGSWSVVVSAADASVLSGVYDVLATVGDLAGNVSEAATKTLTASVAGVASDGYISGATYFVDIDGDMMLGAGEASTIGDSVGNYRLPSGPVVMKGGTDISTGMEFTSVYEAPTGYRTITPITTLVREISKVEGYTVSDAELLVKALIGHDINLSTFNPLIEAARTTGADLGAALAYQKIAAELSVFMDVASTLLGHVQQADASTTLARTQHFSNSIIQELTWAVIRGTVGAAPFSADDLFSESFIDSVFSSIIATDPILTDLSQADHELVVAATRAAAALIALANKMIDGITSDATSAGTIAALKSITQYQVVVKGQITTELLAYLTDTSALLPNYDGATFSNAASTARVGVIVPALITGLMSGAVAQAEGSADSGASWTFTFTRSGDTSAATELSYEVLLSGAGSAADFGGTIPSGTITLLAGETTATLVLTTHGNNIAELQKSFALKVYDATGKTQFLDSGNAPTGALNFGFALNNDDAPSLIAPPALELQTDVAARISGVSVVYPDAEAELTVTLTGVAGSKIILPDGANVANNGSNQVTLTGKAAAINAALATLSVSSPAGADHLTMTVAAQGVAATTTTNIPIHLHEAPTLSGPSSLPMLVAGTDVAVHGFTAGDSDSAQITAQVKVDGGSASFLSFAGVTKTTGPDGLISLAGAPSDVSNALASMSLKAAATTQVTVSVKVIDGDVITADPSLVLAARASAAPTVLTAPSSAALEQGHATTIPITISDADSPLVTARVTSMGGSVGFGSSGVVATGPGGFGGFATGSAGGGASGATVLPSGGGWSITGSVAAVNAKLASMTFTASSIGAASLTIVADDGDPATAAVTKVIALTVGANAAPDAGGDLDVAAVTEDTASTLMLTGFHFADSSGGAPTQIRILSVEGGTLTAAGGAPITLGASGTALTVAHGSLALGFTPSSNSTADARITYVVVDPDINSQNSTSSVITIPITAVNDAPVLALNAASQAYVENAAPTLLAPGLALSDVDSSQMTSAVVTISTGASAGDVLAVTAALPSGVTASFANGTLTITGAASVSEYEAILKSVTFSNTSDAPSTVARQITFAVSDGAATSVARVIDVTVSDLTAPTATISATGEQITNGMATAQIVFSEAVTGFTQSDLTITNGVIDHVTMLGDKTAIVTFKPTGASGSLTLSGDYADLAGNAGAKGAALSFTINVPQMIGGDTSARVIDEDLNNSGRIISPGVTIVDADNHDFAGGSLRAHINNRVGVANVAGDVLGIRGLSDGSGCFRAVGDDIYYRQPTGVASNGSVPASDAAPVDEIRIGSIATIGGVRQDGSRGADLVISLNENATPAVTQTLASNIVFAVKLSGGAYTQAWQDFPRTNTSVTFTLSDGQGNSSTLLTPITVVAHNDAPVATSDVQAIGQSATDPATGNVLANDTDADNVPGLTQQALTVSGVASGANHATFSNHSATVHGQYGVLTISDAGAYSYVLDNDNTLVHSLVTGGSLVEKFTYDVSDGIDTVGSKLEITINGTAANLAPVANADQANASNTGGRIAGNILANDTDANGQSLQVTDAGAGTGALEPVKSAGATLHGTYGDLTLTADGAYTYTPDATNAAVQGLLVGETLTETYTYSISDGHGGTSASTLTITINGTVENAAPVANADQAAMNNTDDPVTGNVLLNDTDANGQTLHVTGVSMSLEGSRIVGQYGVMTLNADGSYSYAPDATKTAVKGLVVGDTLTDNFNYSISDGYGGVSSSTLAITINGVMANAPPEAVADEISMTLGDGSASGNVLANDTDANGQTLHVVGVPSGTAGTSFVGIYGTLTLKADGAYIYTPNAANPEVSGLVGDASLTDTFDYSISDGHGGNSSSTLAITINAPAPNAAPTGVADQARGTPYGDVTGNVLSNDTDPEHQALTVTGATASEGDFSGAPDATISGRFGDLTISADGHYVYTPNASAVRTSVPLFGSATETFYYQLSDGHGGFADATLNIEVVNSPLVIKGAPGTFTVSDTIGGVTKVIGLIDIPPGSESAIWIKPDTYIPADGSHVLSVSGGGGISAFGGATSQTAGLEILDIAHLPQTPAANTLYIVHDTRENIAAAQIGDTPFAALLTSHLVMGVIVNGAGPAGGGYEALTTSHIPVMGYDTQISLPATARIVNEDDNNTGRLIAFSGTGFAIAKENPFAVGPTITDPELGFAVGATLRVHINNAVTNSVGGDVLFLKQGSNVFRTDVDGKIYYRQGTTIDGATSDAVTIDDNPLDDVQFASFATNTSGKFLNGMGGRDLVVTFNDKATPDLVQLLAGHIGFGIRLNTTDGTAGYTQAWQQFLPGAGVQQSVTFTITDVAGRSNSASRDINVQAVNDAPVAHNDLTAIGKADGSVTGWVLGNDDPDLLPNQGSESTSLPIGLGVKSVSHGTASGTLGSSLTGDYGSLIIKSDGTYTYTLNTNNADVQNLTSGALLDVFHYTMKDGSGATSYADLKIMIDALGVHWGSESKTSSNSVTAADTIFKHAGASETQYVYGFAGDDVLGAVGPGTVKIDGGDGDDVMFALAAHTSLKGGAGMDTFVIGSADIDLRIEDLQLLSNPAGHDTVDFSLVQQALGMTKEALWAYNEAHITQVTDASTGKLSTELSFAGAGHSGKVLFVGVTAAQAVDDMPGLFDGSLAGGYGLLDELKLIAANHG